jgi:biopolymer transport protein ExbD
MISIGGKREGSQDFELNLASIIDCFTVLITFMLASASFLSLGILDAGVAAAGASQAATTEKAPAVNVTVELRKGFEIGLKVSGRETSTTELAPVSGAFNFDSLEAKLRSVRERWPDTQAVTLSAADDVPYAQVVSVMDRVRKTIPAVLLGGF